ncbi:MAG TPA: HEAT repeat domain-containing protein [Vicinamibacterales bacterium]|nr:HEAT repeat domain-containing protein [Vicinamibacterales bacterium]
MVMTTLLLMTALTAGPFDASQARFDDVVRNLRNPDPDARMEALKTLREAQHLEAITPIALLVNDPLDVIQLEAIAAELSFYLVESVHARKRIAFLIETRSGGGGAQSAFDSGPLAVWPRPVPPELVASLLKAVDDEHGKVRLEAIYALGTIARAPLAADAESQLIKALDHYDPDVRAAAARVVGRLRVKSAGDALIKAVNDSRQPVRYAAMRALGDIKEEKAIAALTQQFEFYRKNEGGWSALDGLAKIAHASSVPLFKARLVDKDPYLRRASAEGLARAGDASAIPALEAGAGNDSSDMVRAAMAFALQMLGKDYVPRLAAFLKSEKLMTQVSDYFLELGPGVATELVAHLKDPDEAIRGNAALVLGAIGSQAHVAALQAVGSDRDRDVARAATRAIERIKMRSVGL